MKSYLRFLSRNKLYTAIEVVGLSIAIAMSIPIICHINEVRKVNSSHADHKDIYSLSAAGLQTSSPHIGEYLKENIPEIETVSSPSHISGVYNVDVDGIMGSYMLYDNNFFYFFPYEFIEGGLDTELKTTAAVSEKFAAKLAKNGPVIGRSIHFDQKSYVISGIYKNSTDPRLDEIDIMFPRISYSSDPELVMNGNNIFIMTFIKVREGTDYDILKKKVQDACAGYWGPMDDREIENSYSWKRPERYDIIPYEELTTRDNYQLNEFGGAHLATVIAIAIVLLTFAVTNYINLNVALSTRRAKEIATRKLVGSKHWQIYWLFVKEALIMNVICFALGLALTGFTTGIINSYFATVDAEAAITASWSFANIAGYMGLFAILTLITGLVPATIVSRFTPLDITKGAFRYHSKKRLTKSFICIQTILTILLLAITLIFNSQYRKYLDMEYNCDIEDVFHLMTDKGPNVSLEALKSELMKQPEILSVGNTARVPSSLSMMEYQNAAGERIYVSPVECTEEAFKIFGFEIMTTSDTSDITGLWMTPEAVKMERNHPEDFDEMIRRNFGDYRIAGMIENIPTGGGQNNIDDFPAIVFVTEQVQRSQNELVIKTIGDHEKARKVIASVYEDVTGIIVDDPRDFAVRSMYIKEINEDMMAPWNGLNRLLEKLLAIILFLGVMGLSGMSIHFATEREKEIAVRKVFGGTSGSELKRNLMVFIRIAAIANMIAIPIAVIAFETIMRSFADKIDSIWIIYLACVIISFIITLATVLWQTLRAARTNPAEALKKE